MGRIYVDIDMPFLFDYECHRLTCTERHVAFTESPTPFGTLDRYNNFFFDKKPKNFVNTFDISFHLDIIQRNFLFQSKFKTRELSIISTNYI